MNNQINGSRKVIRVAFPTIGLLMTEIYDPYQIAVKRGIEAALEELNANLICLVGGDLPDDDGQATTDSGPEQIDRASRGANAIFDLVDPANMAGLVILAGSLGAYASAEKVRHFCERYRPLPLVSVALELENIPSILVSNYQGMYEVVTHLIGTHNHRRIAFIRGPTGHPEAEERYRAYAEALAGHGLPLDPALVAPGVFDAASGVDGVRLILDERKASFDALVAVDDATALGALEALHLRGIEVPGEVAVAGFDDVEASRLNSLPLTTVRQPLYEMGRLAAETLLAQLAGQEVPGCVTLPTAMVVRQSCGCVSQVVQQSMREDMVSLSQKGPAATFSAERDTILSIMQEAGGKDVAALNPAWAGRLLDTFMAGVEGQSMEAFLIELDAVLGQIIRAGGNLVGWQHVLSVMRRQVRPFVGQGEPLARAENLWQQARVLVGEAMERAQAHRNLQAWEQTLRLNETGIALTMTLELERIMDLVEPQLVELGIPSCYLSLFEEPAASTEYANLTMAYDQQGRIALEPGERRFPSRQLAPGGLPSLDRGGRVFVVSSLHFGEERFGFIVFEAGPPDGIVYETLARLLSSALRGILLWQKRERAERALEKAYTEVEQQVEQRTAELQQEVVAREHLQQQIIEAQQQALKELSTPIIPVMDVPGGAGSIIVMPLIGSIDTIRARDITRALLKGISNYRAKIVIVDITGVPLVDTGVANHLNKTFLAARLKGARTIVTGVSEAVAETIVDLGIDWHDIQTLSDLQTGLKSALRALGLRIEANDPKSTKS